MSTKKNKSMVSQALLEMEEITSAIKEESKKSLNALLSEAVRDAIKEAESVFIVGHKNMDFDCMGANLLLSRIARGYQKPVYIVSESGKVISHPTLSLAGVAILSQCFCTQFSID